MATTHEISRLIVRGLHGRHDINISFHEGLNIIHGRNGTGKTTILHIIANIIDRDFSRFLHIIFGEIEISTRSGNTIKIKRTPSKADDEVSITLTINNENSIPIDKKSKLSEQTKEKIKSMLGGRPVYLPAFRAILEAISGETFHKYGFSSERHDREIIEIARREEEENKEDQKPLGLPYHIQESSRATAFKTVMCRDWFGPFLPAVRFPSLWDVSEQLFFELREAEVKVASTDRSAFSSVFVDVLRAVIHQDKKSSKEDTENILERLKKHLSALQDEYADAPEAYRQIDKMLKSYKGRRSKEEGIPKKILEIYDKALMERTREQEAAYSRIRTFELSVNKFLEEKNLAIERQSIRYSRRRAVRRMPIIKLDNGDRTSLAALSSGERHVLTLLFSATHMSISDGALLIDEPELSLHVGWQRIILDELMRQAGERQVIACTHSPEVAGHHRSRLIEISPTPTKFKFPGQLSLDWENGLNDDNL
ncbi:MAG: AAA family ATPase [Ectothiorhodospiraceae bacterium]|nr:AAA family ATPase [Ectothiorhodospiraceae bacterium]